MTITITSEKRKARSSLVMTESDGTDNETYQRIDCLIYRTKGQMEVLEAEPRISAAVTYNMLPILVWQ